jgi:hypothetical protein
MQQIEIIHVFLSELLNINNLKHEKPEVFNRHFPLPGNSFMYKRAVPQVCLRE